MMLKKQTKLGKVLTVILLLGTVSACGTRETLKIVPISNACLVGFKEIKYSIQPTEGSDDATNKYDTIETVEDIQEYNATYRAICEDQQD